MSILFSSANFLMPSRSLALISILVPSVAVPALPGAIKISPHNGLLFFSIKKNKKSQKFDY